MNNIEKLTGYQKSIGYTTTGTPGTISLLGIAGKSGEVMNEALIYSSAVSPVTIAEYIGLADSLDEAKKLLRCSAHKGNVVIEDPVKFKSELADLVYYVNAAAIEIGSSLDELAGMGYEKGVRKNIEQTLK